MPLSPNSATGASSLAAARAASPPDVQAALAAVARRFGLVVRQPNRTLTGARGITVAPADLGGLSVGLEPLALVPRRIARPRARARAAGAPVLSAPVRVEAPPAAVLGGAPVTIDARLVLQGIDGPLSGGEVRIVPDPAHLHFAVLAAPHFVEAGARGRIDGRIRRIAVQARVRASATVAGVAYETPETPVPDEPIELSLLPVELPTLLALFPTRDRMGAGAERGSALVLVPPGSAVPERAGRPGDILPDTLIDVAHTLERLPALAAAMGRLLRAAELLAPANVVTVRHAPQTNLDRIEPAGTGGPPAGTEGETRIGSLFLLGRPGTVADLFCARDLRAADGHLRVTLDPDGSEPIALAVLESQAGTRATGSPGVTVSAERESRAGIAAGGRALAAAVGSVQLAAPDRSDAGGSHRYASPGS